MPDWADIEDWLKYNQKTKKRP